MPTADLPEGVVSTTRDVVVRCTNCGLIWTQRARDPLGVLRRSQSRAVGFRSPDGPFEPLTSATSFEFDDRHYLSE